jgi:outer membrane protein assembly factor BamB
MKRVILTALSISLMPVLGYGQLPPLDAAEGTWMMHHGAASLRGLQRLRGAITGPNIRCSAVFDVSEGDPIVADINGDGSNEIVIAGVLRAEIYAFRGTDCSLLWSSSISSSGLGSYSVAVGELDPTRTGLEIAVVVEATQQLYVLSGTDGSIIWSAYVGYVNRFNPTTIADIDGDGVGEIFVSSSHTTYAFRGNGTLLWSYPAGYYNSNVAVGDLGNDGTLEVVFVGWDELYDEWRVFALRATNGNFVWSYPISSFGDVALADLDNDGQLEVVVAYEGGGVIALRHNGTLYWSRTFSSCTAPDNINAPTIADLDGDVLREIVIGCYSALTVYALRGTDGSILWSYSNAAAHGQNSSRKIGDIDSDGALEVVLTSYNTGYDVCTSTNPCPYHLIVLNGATGTVEWAWQNPLGTGFEGLAIADVDNDGCMEIIVGPNGASGGERFYVLDSPTPVSDCGVLGYDDPVKVGEEGNIGGVYLLVSPVKGGVNVETGRKAFVEIYTTDGRKVKGLEVDRSAFVELNKGTYIFRVKGHNLYRTVIVR